MCLDRQGCYSAVVDYFEMYIYVAGALAIVVLTIEVQYYIMSISLILSQRISVKLLQMGQILKEWPRIHEFEIEWLLPSCGNVLEVDILKSSYCVQYKFKRTILI